MSQPPQRHQQQQMHHSPQPQQRRGSFSLFPSPNSSKPPQIALDIQAQRGRRSESVERRAITPQERRAATPDQSNLHPGSIPLSTSPAPSASHNGRQTPQQRAYTPIQFEARRAVTPTNWPLGSDPAIQEAQVVHVQRHANPAAQANSSSAAAVQQPRPVNEVPGRTDTGFSEANTLVRSNSNRSRSSIAKHPLDDNQGGSSTTSPPQALRSIFPTYNPGVPLVQQEYAPTQMSPTHIPRAVISRQSHYYEEPESPTQETSAADQAQSPPRSPRRPAARGRWPLRIQTQPPPKTPQACKTEDLKSLWKVANGWQASSSEGRIFCLKVSQQKDAPAYTLSSATSHPFWNLRLDPTSTSAYVNLTRHDPSKPYKAPKPQTASSPSGDSDNGGSSTTPAATKSTDPKNWYEALTTTLEEESRKHPPNDGLVALLMPTAATRMALERADDPVSVMTAENECARLVWDEDTATHFLVHNALAKPFCVTIERSPAYSRTEYTLEHNESPQHLAKLTKDGTGGGWIELDTGIASKIDSYYILDVAVTALLLVAAVEERSAAVPMETFEPPPPVLLGDLRRSSGRLSKLSLRREDKKNSSKTKVTMEAFEIDVESQDDSLGKGRRESKLNEEKLPFLIRVVVKLTKGVFKLLVWMLTVVFKCFTGVFKVLYKCLGSKY